MIGGTRKSWLVLAFAAICLLGGVAHVAHAEDDKTAQVEKLFREGVDLYLQGKFSDAQRKLRAVLELDPRKELAARLVDEAGTKVMAKMMADVRMGNEPTYIWQLYRQHYIGKLANKERMVKMAARLVDANTKEDERALLYREFGELGHYAVPALAPFLKDATHEDYRTYARLAIARMGSRAVLPVIELLNHKELLMRENAILILSDIQPLDPRAIPALKARVEDEKEEATAKAFATRVLQKVTGLKTEQFKAAANYYHDLANRYFLDRAGVAEEAEEVDGFVWHLNGEGDLVAVQYPLWAWNDQMAEENALRGMAVHADATEFYALWACIQGAQYTEVKDLLDIVGEQPTKHNFSAEEKTDIEAWDKKLVDARRLTLAVGKEHCNAALTKVLADVSKYKEHIRLPQVGAYLAGALAMLDPNGELLTPPPEVIIPIKSGETVRVSTGSAPVSVGNGSPNINVKVKANSLELMAQSAVKNGKHAAETVTVQPNADVSASALVNGLDCSEETIQYACALALAKINCYPSLWIGSDKVARILGRGVSENKAVQILVVEESHDAANEMRQRLEGLGYGVTMASGGRDAMLQARSFPPKDITIISDSLRRDFSVEQLLEEMSADVRTRYLPAGVLHKQADRTTVQSRVGTDLPLVEREATGNDLKTMVEAIIAKRAAESIPKRKAREIAVACATGLSHVHRHGTHLVLDDAVEHCIGALTNRSDDVRIPSAVFLGLVEGGTKKEAAAQTLAAVFNDANNAVELRRAALRALGRVQKEGLEEIYVKAQADADQEIKDIGAEGFGQISRKGASIRDFVSAQRIEKDKKEK